MTEVRLMYHESKLDVTCDMCGAYTSKWTERLDRLRRCEKCDTNYYQNAFDPLYKPLLELCLECSHDRSHHYYTQNELLGCQLCECIVFSTFDEHNLGPNAPIVTNSQGGMQSATSYRMDLLDAPAIMRLANILDYGAKRYTPNNWRKIPVEDHINHALIHIFAHMSGDSQDDHLGHAFCRLMFALGVEHEGH